MMTSMKGVWRDVVYEAGKQRLFSSWDLNNVMAPVAQQIWVEASGELWQELGDQFWDAGE